MKDKLEEITTALHGRLIASMARVKLTPDLAREHGPHLARVLMLSAGELSDPDGTIARESDAQVAALYKATHPWPPATIGTLVMSYLLLEIARRQGEPLAMLGSLIDAAYGIGFADAEVDHALPRNLSIAREMLERTEDEKRKSFLASAGQKGGQKKSEPTNRLRSWAIERATGMKGSSKQIARSLVRMLPVELQNVSVDPERIIYEALLENARNRRKSA